MYIATHCQQNTLAEVGRTECAEDGYGSCVCCCAMYIRKLMDVIYKALRTGRHVYWI